MTPDREGGAEADGAVAAAEADGEFAAMARRAAAARAAADPSRGADGAGAVAAARDGLGPAVARYVEARTGRYDRLSVAEHAALEAACDDWLAVYAARLGVECDPAVPVRTVAEALLDTHDVVAAAGVVTGVHPEDVADGHDADGPDVDGSDVDE